jgi:hypothetical protein
VISIASEIGAIGTGKEATAVPAREPETETSHDGNGAAAHLEGIFKPV